MSWIGMNRTVAVPRTCAPSHDIRGKVFDKCIHFSLCLNWTLIHGGGSFP